MKSVTAVKDMQAMSREWRRDGQRIAFVPTMGNLHAGHLALIEQATTQADRVVVSIFVNPLQFNELDDFVNYPRTLDQDRQQLLAYPVDAVFVPTEAELYPHTRETMTIVEVPDLSNDLEGKSRPGHFRGVATVVTKLFNCVLPDVAVFGEKDYQQLLVIRRLVADLDIPIEIVGCPTVRESDGLALSSRNQRFSTEQRQKAPAMYQVLVRIRDNIRQGETDFAALAQQAQREIALAGLVPEYVAVRRAEDLAPPQSGEKLVIVAAAKLGSIRLIDNLLV
jgi:pantoate--beta-alanine ligase